MSNEYASMMRMTYQSKLYTTLTGPLAITLAKSRVNNWCDTELEDALTFLLEV